MAELVDAKYGENKVYEQQQQVMPAAQAQALPPAPTPTPESQGQSEPLNQMPSIGPFNAPTARPDEPVTAGGPYGPGPNSLAMGPQGPYAPQMLSRTLASYGAVDDSGVIAELAQHFDGMNI
jgi:hypothetical protein